jgi:hypothetical protein
LKRGQITLFIIIGLILLVSISIVIYLTTQKITKPIEAAVIVPEDIQPVYDYIDSCAKNIAHEGLGLLGLQGGFIQLPGIIERTPTAYIPIDSANYFKVPLWYYEGEDRTPSLGYMEREISRHLNSNMKDCTGDFEPFKDRYVIKEAGNISTRTTIADNEVIVRINWPLDLVAADRTTRIPDFVVRMPVKLKQMWELANATMASENEKSFFENATIDLMAADSENIPLDGLSIECGIKRWTIPDVQNRLEQLLYYIIPTTRVKNTNFFPFLASQSTYATLHKDFQSMTKELEQGKDITPPKTEAPDDAYQYFKFFFDVGAKPSNLKMGFEYQPAWGMQMNAQPSQGPMLKSNSGKGPGKFLRFLCINQWHFTYDVIYYIKASVRDDSAFEGQGFVFQFAFPVLINRNAPERVAFGLRRFQAIDFGAPDFCTTFGDNIADIRVLGSQEGIPVKMEMPDVQITYKCFDQECDLGATAADAGVYRLSTYLPRGCTNPFITAAKDGYLAATKQMTGGRLDIDMKKLQDMNLTFVVYPYHGETKTWGTPRPLTANERVSLSVSLVNGSFDQFVGFPTANDTFQLVQSTEHYDIDAMLFLRDNQIGGYNVQTYKIPYDSIAGKTKAIIPVVQYMPAAITDEQKLKMMSYVMEGEYRERLQPQFE